MVGINVKSLYKDLAESETKIKGADMGFVLNLGSNKSPIIAKLKDGTEIQCNTDGRRALEKLLDTTSLVEMARRLCVVAVTINEQNAKK